MNIENLLKRITISKQEIQIPKDKSREIELVELRLIEESNAFCRSSQSVVGSLEGERGTPETYSLTSVLFFLLAKRSSRPLGHSYSETLL